MTDFTDKFWDTNYRKQIGKLIGICYRYVSNQQVAEDLAHDAFVESGLITKNNNKQLNLYPHLNFIENTKTIIAENSNKIIGTNSITVDGTNGLHTDNYFKEETDKIRYNSSEKIGSSWRIATCTEYHRNIRLLLDIIQNSVELAVKMNIEICLYAFNKKHENFYKQLLNAETIAQKKINQKQGLNTELVLMKTDTEKTRNHLNKLFIKRKF